MQSRGRFPEYKCMLAWYQRATSIIIEKLGFLRESHKNNEKLKKIERFFFKKNNLVTVITFTRKLTAIMKNRNKLEILKAMKQN